MLQGKIYWGFLWYVKAIFTALLCKTISNKGHFPSDDAAIRLIYLALRQIEAKWRRPKQWHAAKSQLAIQFGERFTLEN